MDDPTDPAAPPWTAGRNAKQKNAVQRNVNALLNALAPERTLTRGETAKVLIEQHRTPSGCVLQAPAAALSVSWFESDTQSLGELHIVLWSGVVTRRGTPARGDGATILAELVLAPIDPPNDGRIWRAKDGKEFDTPALAAHCLALLEDAMERRTRV
jgi:hypothetical protein